MMTSLLLFYLREQRIAFFKEKFNYIGQDMKKREQIIITNIFMEYM